MSSSSRETRITVFGYSGGPGNILLLTYITNVIFEVVALSLGVTFASIVLKEEEKFLCIAFSLTFIIDPGLSAVVGELITANFLW